jgi:hypothetical protein
MIFVISALVAFIACFVFSIFKAIDNDEDELYFWLIVISAIVIVILLMTMICGIVDSSEFNAKLLQMRLSPQNFSIQDASKANEKLVRITYWKNTIFSFYKNVDTTLLDLSKFVKI